MIVFFFPRTQQQNKVLNITKRRDLSSAFSLSVQQFLPLFSACRKRRRRQPLAKTLDPFEVMNDL
jgi:hypothetical protein